MIQKYIKAIFFEDTNDTIIQFIRYIFVGGAAFVADAGVLWLCSHIMHYLIATAIAFVAGLIINFMLSKMFIFGETKTKTTVEFLVYAVIGVIGLLITEGLMYIFTDVLGLYLMLSKIITAAIVLIWNFGARKIILYRGKNE